MRANNTAAFYTLGCKLNFAETSTIARSLEDEGFAKVPFDHPADVYVINTCSVTENADRKCRNIVRKGLGQNPDAFVIVVGCYAQLKPKDIAQIEGVDLVLGANEKFNATEFMGDLTKREETTIAHERIRKTKDFVPSYSAGGRTRSFLKVQDGCDYFCSFCTIPLARGKSRSATIDQVVANAKEIARKGIKEIVLTGVNIGDFKNDLDEDFFQLIQALDLIEGIERYRISSIEPNLLDERIIDFVATSKKFMPHFHIPLQSGSDTLLKSMRRKYDVQLYCDRVAYIKKVMPHACIGVDVIVGYPGETDEEFMTTYDLLTDLDVSYLHVFTYSERNRTLAKKMMNVVPQNIRKDRSKRLRILSLKKVRAFYEQYIGDEQKVLFEAAENEGKIEGYSDNYVRVIADYDAALVNQIVPVKLTNINSSGTVDVSLVKQTLTV